MSSHRDLKADPPVAAPIVVYVDLQVLRGRAFDPAKLDVDAAATRARVGDLQ